MQVRFRAITFRTWCTTEELRKQIAELAGQSSPDLTSKVVEYCSAVSYFGWLLRWLHWVDVINFYYVCVTQTFPKKIPLLNSTGKADKDLSWNYPGRDYYFYVHLLAKKYGWSRTHIDEMNVNDVFSFIQEILTDEQLEREFRYSLSEIAYPYNSSTKKNEFKPLERPYWMWKKAPEIKKIKIPKALMPQGVIEDVGGMAKYLEGAVSKTDLDRDD